VKNKDILDSWKEISQYLNRNRRTCQRWEQNLRLPVHRFDTDSSHSKVFAYKSEIEEWLQEQTNCKEIQKKSLFENKWAVTGFVFVSALILIIFAYSFFINGTSTSHVAENPAIAVFPFENNSSEYDEYFSVGVTNEIISNISRVSKIKVIPVFPDKGEKNNSNNPQQISKQLQGLNVDYFLKGIVEKHDDKIKIYIQLSRAKDNKNIWDHKYYGQQKDIFSIQQDICIKIGKKLNLKIDQTLLSYVDGSTHDYIAFDNYLKGNYILNRTNGENYDPWKLYFQGKYYSGKWTPESNELAISLYHEAINIDSSFAKAYIGLAQCYARNVNLAWDFKKEWLDKAEELVNTAQAISPYLPEYYNTLIEIYLLKELDFNRDEKPTAFELALEGIKKYPYDAQLNSITGYCYFVKFGKQGNETDLDKALEYKEKSFLINPYGLDNINLAEILMLKKEFYRAIDICNHIKKHDSSLLAKFRLGEIYYYLGDLDKSKVIFQQFNMPLNLKIYALFHLGMIAAQNGETQEAQRIIQEINILIPEDYKDFDEGLRLASIYMGIGNKELGYKHLESSFNTERIKDERFIYCRYINIDRNFDLYREEEMFKKIIKGGNIWLEAKK